MRVLDRRVRLAVLLSEVELNILNDLLQGELDKGLFYGSNDKYMLDVRELEITTRTMPVEFTSIQDTGVALKYNAENPGHVEFNHSDWAMDVHDEWLFAITDHNNPGYFYIDGNLYLEIKPEDVMEIFARTQKGRPV